MAILLGIDLETTGLNPATDEVIEVGAVLWDTDTGQPLDMYSSLILGRSIPSEITDMTRITPEMRRKAGVCWSDAFAPVLKGAKDADYLVAHNASFEKSFLENNGMVDLVNMAWVDTKTDIPYYPGKGRGSLSEIAMAHGVFNILPHRALPDVMAMFQVLTQYHFPTVEQWAKAPTVTLYIQFPYDPTGAKNAQVKSLGYYWDPANKWWHKPVKEFLVQDERRKAEEVGFHADVLNPIQPTFS